MDAEEFHGVVDTKVDEIEKAFMSFYEDNSFSEAIAKMVRLEKPNWRNSFIQFAGSDASDARGSASTANTGVDFLRTIALDDLATPLESIREDITDWHGTAKTSFQQYLNGVENALQYQTECAIALSGFMDIQRGLVDAGYESAIEIADQTVAALKKIKKEEERNDRKVLGSIVTAVAAAIGTVISGGAVGVIAGAVTAVGAIAGAQIQASAGDNPWDAIEWMNGAIGKAVEDLNADRAQLGTAMAECHKVFFGESGPKVLLPPKAGLAEA